MNGCMQDAFNLGWKLASVFKGESPHSILDTYEKERKPIGSQISNGAMATHEVVMGFGIPPEDRLHLTQEPGWEWRTINLVSGLSHNYRDVSVLPDGLTKVSGPQAGERAPDARLIVEPKRRLYDACRHPQFTLLVAPGTASPDEVIDLGAAARDELNRLFPGHISTYLVSKTANEPRFDFDHQSEDELDEFTERYQIGPDGRLVLVRPDLYVGMACQPKEWGAVVKYLSQWFMPQA